MSEQIPTQEKLNKEAEWAKKEFKGYSFPAISWPMCAVLLWTVFAIKPSGVIAFAMIYTVIACVYIKVALRSYRLYVEADIHAKLNTK